MRKGRFSTSEAEWPQKPQPSHLYESNEHHSEKKNEMPTNNSKPFLEK
jgi:hypothetical protein